MTEDAVSAQIMLSLEVVLIAFASETVDVVQCVKPRMMRPSCITSLRSVSLEQHIPSLITTSMKI